jgi:monothiol glutaredoxin
MTVIDRIKEQLSSAPVVLYMKGTPDFPQCGFSAQTVGARRAVKAKFEYINIFEDPEVRDALKT